MNALGSAISGSYGTRSSPRRRSPILPLGIARGGVTCGGNNLRARCTGMANLGKLRLGSNPVICPRHDPRPVILGGLPPDRMQSRRRVPRTEGDQVGVAHMFGCIHDPLLKALIAGERRVLPAA